MSRVLNGNLATDITDEVLTLCRAWEITKTDSTVMRLTDHDKDITFLGETFVSDSGFTTSAMESGENLAVDNTDLKVLLKTSYIEEADLINGVFDGARVKVYLVNYLDTSSYTALPGAFLSKIKSADSDSAIFEMTSLSAKLNQQIGRIITPLCDADLGDSRCGVTLATYTVTGTITSVSSNSVFTDSSRAEADDYFNYGLFTWTSGNNNGTSFEVKDFGSGQFTIHGVCPSTVTVGDTYSVYRGCDNRATTCKNTFSNYDNFRGFPFNIDNLDLVGGPK